MAGKKLALALAVVTALAVPGAAQAKTTRGTVLSVDRAHHALRLVENEKTVVSLRYRGRLDRRVRSGSVVTLNARGHAAAKVRPHGHARQVQVLGRVVRSSGRGLTVSLPDGRTFALPASGRAPRRAAVQAAGALSLNFEGLQPGQTVLITIDYSQSGDVTVTVKLVDQSTSSGSSDNSSGDNTSGDNSSGDNSSGDNSSGDGSGDNSGSSQPSDSCGDPNAADGTVVAINHIQGVFTLADAWGDDTTYSASSQILQHMHQGDQVLVQFDPSDTSTATGAKVLKSSVAAPDPGYSTADGVVSKVLGDAGQFVLAQHGGSLTFDGPCWLLNQVWQSEDVHVVYHQDASGDLVADAVDANDGSEL